MRTTPPYLILIPKWSLHSEKHTKTETHPLCRHSYTGHKALLCWYIGPRPCCTGYAGPKDASLHKHTEHLMSSCSADSTLLSGKCLNKEGLGKKVHHLANLPKLNMKPLSEIIYQVSLD